MVRALCVCVLLQTFLSLGHAQQPPYAAAAARPNLIPLSVGLGNYSVRPGDTITVTWTMTNSGSASCPPSFTGLQFGISPSIPPNNGLRDATVITPEIPARSAVRQTNSITLASTMPLGTYYLWVIADDVQNSSLNQTSRADDIARSGPLGVEAVRRQPNLVPQNIALSTSTVRPGDQVTITWTLVNSGTVLAPASVTGLHLGTSTTSPTGGEVFNARLDTPEIPPNATFRFTNTVTIPTNAAFGTYYFWVVADDVTTSTLNQSSRADDAARSSALSVVAVLPQPNLVPKDVTLNTYMLRPGDPLTVTWTTSNSGNANAPSSTTGLHLGSSATAPPTNDALNLRVATTGISAGASVRQTNTITIPANFPVGTNYLWVVADDVPNSTLNQSSKADDAARSAAVAIVSVIRRPNLVPTHIVLGAEFVRPGDQLTVAWTMTNSGNGIAPQSRTGLRLGQSATVAPTNGFAMVVDTPAINTNSSVRLTNLVTIPANTPLGSYYLWVVADDGSTLDQSSRADDTARSSALGVVSVVPRPNLVPVNVSLGTAALQPGQQVTVTWTMRNSGDGNSPASTTGLHLGTSPTVAPTNDALNLKISTPAITAGSSLNQSSVVTIPVATVPGTYYLWVVADDDPNSTLNQSSRTDDAARSPAFTIARATLTHPAPDQLIEAPPTFTWSSPGIANAKVYLAAKPAPVLGLDKVVFFDNPPGTTAYRPPPTNWITAINTLGFATNYYWTVGSASATQREIYAEWRPFRATPLVTAPGAVVGSGGQFRFVIAAPHYSSIIVQASETLTNGWADIATLQNVSGAVTYTDPSATGGRMRFYRVKGN